MAERCVWLWLWIKYEVREEMGEIVVSQKSKMNPNTYYKGLEKVCIVNWKSLGALAVDDEARGWKMLHGYVVDCADCHIWVC